jgi:hypothetical protein
MSPLLDAFWRATAYCLHPRVIALSLLPLVAAAGLALALGYFFWEAAVSGVRGTLEGWSLMAAALQWLEGIGGEGFRAVIAPLIIVALAVPVIVVLSLLLVAALMTPSLVSLVAERRFPGLQRRRGAPWWQSVTWSLGCTVLALVGLLASIPLWFIPPLILVVPPLIWGWLTYRVMSFDVLADHADVDERREILNKHRWPLLAMGVLTGYLGAAPSLVWAVSAMALILAPLLIVVSVWLYTLVFAFSSLWFAHYGLAALSAHRTLHPQATPPAVSRDGSVGPAPPLLPPAA